MLRPHAAFSAAYLDNVIIHSDSWAQHLRHVAAVLEALRHAGLTANPKKCTIGQGGGTVFGVPLGKGTGAASSGQNHSDCDLSATQDEKRDKEVLGLAGY